jgi:hypothetical protein
MRFVWHAGSAGRVDPGDDEQFWLASWFETG